jgi:hypothetical protein
MRDLQTLIEKVDLLAQYLTCFQQSQFYNIEISHSSIELQSDYTIATIQEIVDSLPANIRVTIDTSGYIVIQSKYRGCEIKHTLTQ